MSYAVSLLYTKIYLLLKTLYATQRKGFFITPK